MASEMQRVKKAKWVTPGEDREASESPLSAELADQSKRDRLRKAYATALPWPHVVVDSLCRPDVMRVIRDEILELEATYKETDIFKVYQVSQDLRSLNHRRDTLPQLLALRDAVYSPSFRAFVSEVTGCGPLTDQVDCSANFYTQGCHLLCHDDTIGTRRISYIIYFTDPDKEWKHEDGGCFELYAREDTTGVPSTRIMPSFNSMCMFRVVPGESFHSVQEVYTNDNTRISIQGWFHAAEEPEHKERASRLLLQSTDHSVVLQQSAVLGPFIRLAADPGENIEAEEDEDALLSPADVQELGAWINPTYLKPESIAQIREHFTTQSTIQLQQFLTSDLASSIRDLTGTHLVLFLSLLPFLRARLNQSPLSKIRSRGPGRSRLRGQAWEWRRPVRIWGWGCEGGLESCGSPAIATLFALGS
jgi:Rps23 Pro-64 3,4-dihydroxylase Tpa1-like proline 4-hydroxylase